MRRQHVPLRDSEVRNHITHFLKGLDIDTINNLKYQDYDQCFREWVTSTRHTFKGFELFEHSAFSHGTGSAFGEFIARYPGRRVRASNSEFVMARIIAKAYGRDFKSIEDGKITKNDLIILSTPFCGNGGTHTQHDALLNEADDLGVPVMIDGAYIGISEGMTYNFNHECIKDFAVSLSKVFDVMNFRIGIRFSKEKLDDGLACGIIAGDIFNKMGATIGIKLMQEFNGGYIINKYKQKYLEYCRQENLTPTNTITLALGDEVLHKEFKRGDYARICISEDIS